MLIPVCSYFYPVAMTDLPMQIMNYPVLIIFGLIECDYWASWDKVMYSFNVLLIEPTFWVRNIMQNISLVVECAAIINASVSSLSPGHLMDCKLVFINNFWFGKETGYVEAFRFSIFLFAFGLVFSLLVSVFLLILWQLYLLQRYFQDSARILFHIYGYFDTE